MKAFIDALFLAVSEIWQFQNFVKNAVTIDVSGMETYPWEDYTYSVCPLWCIIYPYGVGSTLLVLRSDGYARCLETAG